MNFVCGVELNVRRCVLFSILSHRRRRRRQGIIFLVGDFPPSRYATTKKDGKCRVRWGDCDGAGAITPQYHHHIICIRSRTHDLKFQRNYVVVSPFSLPALKVEIFKCQYIINSQWAIHSGYNFRLSATVIPCDYTVLCVFHTKITGSNTNSSLNDPAYVCA